MLKLDGLGLLDKPWEDAVALKDGRCQTLISSANWMARKDYFCQLEGNTVQ